MLLVLVIGGLKRLFVFALEQSKQCLFAKRCLIARGRVIRFDLFGYVFKLERRAFMTCKQLLLGSNVSELRLDLSPR